MNNRNIYKLSLGMAAVGYIGMAVIGYGFGGNVYGLGTCYLITSIGIGSMFVNQTVMLADVVDYGEYKLGKRNQSLTFSMKGFLQKMAYTVQCIIMYLTFSITKYEGTAPEQTQEAKTEFDVDGTVRETCDNAGTLSVCYKRPRKNTVKVLMLMDSGGSMEYYSNLCSMLFQAARQSNHFKELHVYYFHNCVYSRVYTDPRMYREHGVSTEWLLKNFGSEYKVIFVGDALMDMYELTEKRYDYFAGSGSLSGMDWLKRFKEQYDHLIWLNPEEPPRYGGYWGQSYGHIARLIDMYPLSVDGLERGMKKLLVSK